MNATYDAFKDARESFREFAKAVRNAEAVMAAYAEAILQEFSDCIERIESRAKDYGSIERNYIGKYGAPTDRIDLNDFLRDANDLIGVRVVVYYNSDVDAIRDSLREAYPHAELEEKLTEHDINRGARFGYRAVHLNFEYSDDRIFRLFPRAKAGVEIQIRTILSDAWARHSHKLIYKTPPSDELLRAFAGTAAMLEALDGQIERVRDLPRIAERKQPSAELGWIQAYEAICKIVSVPIDEESLKAFCISAQDRLSLDTADDFYPEFISEVTRAWKLHGNVDYDRYGYKDSLLKLKIALYGLDKEKFGGVIPLYMKARVDNMLQVGARAARPE